MILKWIYNSYEIKVLYTKYRTEYLSQNNNTMNLKTFDNYLSLRKIDIEDCPPKIKNHRSELVFWATFWHISFIYTLLGNPLKHLINFVLDVLKTPLDAQYPKTCSKILMN
jgi:hypothetical protein